MDAPQTPPRQATDADSTSPESSPETGADGEIISPPGAPTEATETAPDPWAEPETPPAAEESRGTTPGQILLLLLLGLAVVGVVVLWFQNQALKRQQQGAANVATTPPKTLRITATVDGSGIIAFTPQAVRYSHKHWSPPTNVNLNGVAWDDLSRTPAGWPEMAAKLNLAGARIVRRTGRDIVALEPTPEGFDLILSDSPNGEDTYEITIEIPARR